MSVYVVIADCLVWDIYGDVNYEKPLQAFLTKRDAISFIKEEKEKGQQENSFTQYYIKKIPLSGMDKLLEAFKNIQQYLKQF